jgi:hypothetical protein
MADSPWEAFHNAKFPDSCEEFSKSQNCLFSLLNFARVRVALSEALEHLSIGFCAADGFEITTLRITAVSKKSTPCSTPSSMIEKASRF